MSADKRCPKCGGTREFVYELNYVAQYYCATCDEESTSETEAYGPDERAADEAGL